MEPNAQLLTELFEVKMPFGKYNGTLIGDLPEHYILWFSRTGFPAGKIGILLQTMYEIKLNGLSYLLDPIRKMKTGK
ncbi:MAG: hypothetical protein BGO31_16080 [Bacteroidetes bacterium 43-16]|nr:MAG: hypothetical protein BGO31_16080 [Bacteroidetes bacterium 43-16]